MTPEQDTLPLPLILALDSSTATASVALGTNEKTLYHLTSDSHGEHAAHLAPMVDQALEHLRSEGLSLDAIAIAAGPGSYTGLRIASSLAKGLAMGFGLPLVAISTLELMASGYRAQLNEIAPESRLCPMIDARRMEVYTTTFDSSLGRLEADRPVVLEGTPLYADLGERPYYFIGSGAAKLEGLWPGYSYSIASDFVPKAQYMLPLATEAYRRGDFVDLAYWTPSYLKEYVATIAKNKVLGR